MKDDTSGIPFSVLGAVVNLQTYKNIAYLLMSFPLGLAYFLFLVIGFSVGFGLSFIVIGIPILIFILSMLPLLAEFERNLANILLGTEITSPNPALREAGFLGRAKLAITRFANIKGIFFCSANFRWESFPSSYR